MTRLLAIYASGSGTQFTIGGQVEPAVLIFAPEVFLPVIAMQADMDACFALGKGLGIEYAEDAQGLFGVSARIPALTGDEMSVIRAAFFARAAQQIFGLSPQAQFIECEPVFNAYREGLMSYVEQTGGLTWPVAQVSLH